MKNTKFTQNKKWFTAALAATGATYSANAAIVQITLTGNQITAGGGNTLNADLTGDSLPDVIFNNATSTNTSTSTTFSFTTYSLRYSAAVNINGVSARASSGATSTGAFGAFSSFGINGTAGISDALIAVSFNDPNYGGAINGWLDVNVRASGVDTGVYLQRLIWDDANLSTAPIGISATDSAFTAATLIPEPSGLALLALGAGGLIARRRRNAA